MSELWYCLRQLPDLTLNQYASLAESGVDGVLEKHTAFLRQINRKGIVSGLSYHLFYLYRAPRDPAKDMPEAPAKDMPGRRLSIYLLIRGKEEALSNVPALMQASPLSEFYRFERMRQTPFPGRGTPAAADDRQASGGTPAAAGPSEFSTCAFLTKTETLLPSDDGGDYYLLREWEMNEDGRLYHMCKMMEALNQTALYRVDLYPVERSQALREALQKPMGILRKRQEERGFGARRDYEGKDVLDSYEDLLETYDSSPHFITNIMVFAGNREDAASILDAAGSEGLKKGKYTVATFYAPFHAMSFLEEPAGEYENPRERMVARPGRPGMIVCREETAGMRLCYLPTLFSLEETEPFFRFPALYDGEVIQLPKETAPPPVSREGALFLGKDPNGYDVCFPLKLLPKHAFVAGVPGSGKTNTMHHITSSLWKEHRIPFLVLEPAKQEYRALANDPAMGEMYLFSPNADMSFPLHINPFEMPEGTLVAEHIRRLCQVFEGAFPLEPPMPFLLDTAIEAVYRELGWIPEHVYTGTEKEADGKKRRLPTMSMLYRRLEQELKTTRYSEEIRGNMESALKVRIGSLMRREMGDVFDVPESTFAPEKWLEVPAVIELESMGTGPANFLTLMLCSLIRETLKASPRFDGEIRHVIFIEEAHNLIGPESEEQTGAEADPKRAATAFVVKMLAEVRALKEGIVIADQLPTVMAQEVLKNTGLKLGLRITSADDRSLLGSTMAASPLQLEQMATFDVGEALIFYEKLMRPFQMRIAEWCGEISPPEEKERMTTSKDDAALRMILADNPAYQEENQNSIRIIGLKYRQMLRDLEKRQKPCAYWYQTVAAQRETIEKLKRYLANAELGRTLLPEEEKLRRYDQLELLESGYELTIAEKEKHREAAEIIRTAGEWAFALERLKCGRWMRAGASELSLIKITVLQSGMCDLALGLYGLVQNAFCEPDAGAGEEETAGRSAGPGTAGLPAEFIALGQGAEELRGLSQDLNGELELYIRRYGAAGIVDTPEKRKG